MSSKLEQELAECMGTKFRGGIFVKNGLPFAVSGQLSKEEKDFICEWNNDSMNSEVVVLDNNQHSRLLLGTKDGYVVGFAYKNGDEDTQNNHNETSS
ncbi:hypothetical protein SJAG_01032 [Schizosaccharomyces japonicus yFS275]|uniref:Uncharacterized protein n=1 Tax=Schizosaccharomyces japonicus (strain yFS275 / FY16936) TaxID=402676 RepID=B6JXA8_SCHJY|nr:hypothetical protein SJAG_01032 [Schizosaccharomyces japonicus yFS275]EEB06009.1 hypothetical protein SJAG_01032 [Schizosaccharomyces japonicus yFS275]